MLARRTFSLKLWLFTAIITVADACAATPFSQYGMIQNVQEYSTNPFYNGTYLTAPHIVYNSGPSLKPGDCESIVQALVENACAKNNNCKNTKLSDIRPTVMINLSTLSGYNYATSCSGYIDEIYNKYVKSNQNFNLVSNVYKPSTTTKTNILDIFTTKDDLPKEQAEYAKRANELKELQSQTKTSSDSLTKTDFPKTIDDLSFAEYYDIQREGYEQYKDAKVYVPLNIDRDDNRYKTEKERTAEDLSEIRKCTKDALDEFTAAQQATINAIQNYKKVLAKPGVSRTESDIAKEEYETAKNNLLTLEAKLKNIDCRCSYSHPYRDEYLKQVNVKCDPSNPLIKVSETEE